MEDNLIVKSEDFEKVDVQLVGEDGNAFDVGDDDDDSIAGDCPDCGGTGADHCDNCDGTGSVECPTCGGDMKCPVCEGRGEVECETCDGNGCVDSEY